MEPMTLGSAPSSPTATVPGFLPSFLMGQHEASTPKQLTSSSPLINRNPTYSLSTNEEVIASPIIKQRLFGPPGPELSTTEATPVSNSTKTGPPRQSLFDTIEVPKHNSYVANDTFNSNTSYSLNSSHVGDKVNNWVTVFGFGPESLTHILNVFSKCGSIVDKRVPSQGNWVNFKFSSKAEAMRALSLNGLVMYNNVMIGVVPYSDTNTEKENIDNTSIRTVTHSVYTTPMRARSLKHSFVSPQNSDTVLPVQNVPQKSTGIVTKAMEMVFGW